MYTITIDDSSKGVDYLYFDSNEWKTYVCEDFDEKVVLLGNRNYGKTEAYAKWWKDAEMILGDLEQLDENEFIETYRDEYPEDTIIRIIKEYKKSNDDTEIIMNIAMIINPSIELEKTTIKGDTQSEWRDVVYVKNTVNIRTLEIFYYGQLTELHIESDHNDDFWDFITNDDLWELEREGNLKKELRARYEIPESEELIIKKFKGYVQTATYETV